MIATSRFVFLHLHKSGGTFVNRLLIDCFPDAQVLGYHLPREYMPVEFRDRPVLGTVRNPWDYYVSWYWFQAAMATPNALFRRLSDGGRLGFADTVRNLVTLGEQPALLAQVVAELPEQFPNRGINLTRRCLAPLAGSGLGFYSFMYRRMYGPGEDATLVRMQELRSALPQALRRLGVEPDAAVLEFLRTSPPLNAGRHERYERYYDPALRDLVGERDAALASRHGFGFGA